VKEIRHKALATPLQPATPAGFFISKNEFDPDQQTKAVITTEHTEYTERINH
jgi:hypothetical protein